MGQRPAAYRLTIHSSTGTADVFYPGPILGDLYAGVLGFHTLTADRHFTLPGGADKGGLLKGHGAQRPIVAAGHQLPGHGSSAVS